MDHDWETAEHLAGLNTGFVVAILIEAKDGEGDAVAEVARRLVPASVAEPGVKIFQAYRSPTNPALFFFFELYVDEAAWKAHEATEHFKTWVPELVARVKRRERLPMVPFLPSPGA